MYLNLKQNINLNYANFYMTLIRFCTESHIPQHGFHRFIIVRNLHFKDVFQDTMLQIFYSGVRFSNTSFRIINKFLCCDHSLESHIRDDSSKRTQHFSRLRIRGLMQKTFLHAQLYMYLVLIDIFNHSSDARILMTVHVPV